MVRPQSIDLTSNPKTTKIPLTAIDRLSPKKSLRDRITPVSHNIERIAHA